MPDVAPTNGNIRGHLETLLRHTPTTADACEVWGRLIQFPPPGLAGWQTRRPARSYN